MVLYHFNDFLWGFVRVLAFGFLLCMSSFAHAQVNFSALNDVTLDLTPRYPGPKEEVQVSLNAYTIDTRGATITWYIDDVKLQQYQNERSIRFTTADIGESSVVRAVIGLPSGTQIPVIETVTPSSVEIFLEAETYAPMFYAGRKLPSSGSYVRAVAILLTGSDTNVKDLTYEWKLNDQTLFGGPVKGRAVASFMMPQYLDDKLSVHITSASGSSLGSGRISLIPVEPRLYFYEENPLLGISRKAINSSYTLIGEEASIRAIPYYMDTKMSELDVSSEWRLNGERVEQSNEINALTLRKVGEGEGSAELQAKFVLARTVPQYVRGSINIFFR